MSNTRTALFNICADYQFFIPPDIDTKQKAFYKGAKRIFTSSVAQGESDLSNAKDAVDFANYGWLSLKFLKSSVKEMIFARVLFVLSWNLMCRISIVIDLCWSHIQWQDDVLCVFFPKQKNDQVGQHDQHGRHVYANPLRLEICPILSIAMYFLIFPEVYSAEKLFPGKDQYARYAKQ